MKERPILFSGAMVRAILEGRKTQTRRVVKPEYLRDADSIEPLDGYPGEWTVYANGDRHGSVLCPYGQCGDRLWVRETWAPGVHAQAAKEDRDYHVVYAADGAFALQQRLTDKWRPSIFMPRWASRITLEVTSVRVERLQDISETDAKAEGIRNDHLPANDHAPDCICYIAEPDDNHAYVTAKSAFEKTWESINAKRAPWASNPWVWIVEFKQL